MRGLELVHNIVTIIILQGSLCNLAKNIGTFSQHITTENSAVKLAYDIIQFLEITFAFLSWRFTPGVMNFQVIVRET